MLLCYLFTLSLCVACVDEDDFSDTPQGNFEALWRIIDEHYCFFDYKQKEYGLDWQEVYRRYKPQFDASMSKKQSERRRTPSAVSTDTAMAKPRDETVTESPS